MKRWQGVGPEWAPVVALLALAFAIAAVLVVAHGTDKLGPWVNL